jgi:phosphoribosyl 1,2-cyclic phosphodiesterase
MSMLKELVQLNEAATPSKFYVVHIEHDDSEVAEVAKKIFANFGYSDIGTADEFLDDEQKESFAGASLPHLDELKVFAKHGLSSSALDRDDELRHQLWKDIDAHDYIGV